MIHQSRDRNFWKIYIWIVIYGDSPKIDTFCVCSKLEKCVNLWRVNFWRANFFQRNFLVQKLTVIKVFYEIRQRNHFTGRDRWALGIDRVSELLRKCFWPKIGDFDKAHQKFWNFENFENFQKMRQSLARQSLAKDCIFPAYGEIIQKTARSFKNGSRIIKL